MAAQYVGNDPADDLPVGITIVGATHDEQGRHCLVFWAPQRSIGSSGETQQLPIKEVAHLVLAERAKYSIQFKNSGRTYQIARKEAQSLALVGGVHTKLYGYDGDFIKSTLPSQTDLSFPIHNWL